MREPKVISIPRIVALNVGTLSIYTLFWYYRANRELRDLGRRREDELRDTRPGVALLAITLGGLLLAPAFVSFMRFAGRLRHADELVHRRAAGVGGLRALFASPLLISFGSAFADLPTGALAGLVALHLALLSTAIAGAQGRLNALWCAERREPRVAAPLWAAGLWIG